MKLREACEKASEFNREQEASGSASRYVVVAKPIGACGGDYQLIERTVGNATPATRHADRAAA